MLDETAPLDDSAAERPAASTPARALRIAFLSYRSDPRVGGQGVVLAQMSEALTKRGHTVDVISGPPYPELAPEVRLIKLPSLDLYAQPHNGHRALRPRHLLSWTDSAEYFGHLSGKFMEPYTFGRRAAKYLRAHRGEYDVVLDNQSISTGLLDIDRMGLPVVGVIHHPIRRDLERALEVEPNWGRRLLIRRWYAFLGMHRRVAPKLRAVITVSEASKVDMGECLGVDQARVTAVPLGIDQHIFRPLSDVKRRDNRILTTASADVPIKGLRFLIRAYAMLLKDHPDLELVVIGKLREGPAKVLIQELGLADKVQFISNLSREQVVEEYAKATVCVTPSLYEGFGLPAAEAMCCGAPVLVTDGGSLPEVVGGAGVIVARGDPEAMARGIKSLLDDPARRVAVARACLARGRERFSCDRAAIDHEAVLLRAAARAC
jgi:glycosyltransferase involved in cell wall biosynthesis